MILHKNQKIIAKDRHRFRVLCAGRRFGKTTLSVEEIKGMAVTRTCNIAYIAPTYQQARDIAWAMLKKELLPVIKNVNESRLEVTIYNKVNTESTIFLRGWESIETLRGQKFDFLIIDEVAMMRNFEEHWQEVLRPTLTDTKGEAIFISTPKGFNHFYTLFNKQDTDEDYKSFNFTSYDNPFLPVEEIDKAKEELTEDRFAQEYLADFRKTEGLVFKEFDRGLHIHDTIPEAKNILAGVDFGYTNPAGILKIIVDKDDNFYVAEEYYKVKLTTDYIIEKVQHYTPHMVYPDPAEPDRIEMMQRAGLNVREVSKDVVAGIDKVREMFKQGRLKIHSSCTNLIWELETYAYPDKRPDNNENEKPIKENDHLVDALRYVIYSYQPALRQNQFKDNISKQYV